MNQGLSVTLGICIAGAGVAVGALALSPGNPPAPQPAPTAQQGHPQATSSPYATPGVGSVPGDSSVGNASPRLVISNFSLQSITVSPGASVAVVNSDSAPHTATAQDGTFDTGTIPAGATGSFIAPSLPGAYQIFCAIHPSMTATLTVA